MSNVKNNLPITKNGYLYVFVSNETPNINVYFDNLQVTHIKGPLLQEQSYYPFGLEMAGISDQAMGKLDSKNKFNGGTELEEDYGVNLYSTFYRKYDPQIGRFSGVDELAEMNSDLTPYQYAVNDPVHWNDPSGLLESSNSSSSTAGTQYIALAGVYVDMPTISFFEWNNYVSQITQLDGGGGGAINGSNGNFFSDGGDGGQKKIGGGNDKLRGGKQKDRDREIKQYPKPFQRWYHREIKPDVHPGRDATPEELREAYKDWSDTQNAVKTVSKWTIIGIGVYETVKWGIAAILAPETGGTSLAAAAAAP
ncbi:MAG: RHS repeat domain-containing protein [Ginsengibacter sp.]